MARKKASISNRSRIDKIKSKTREQGNKKGMIKENNEIEKEALLNEEILQENKKKINQEEASINSSGGEKGQQSSNSEASESEGLPVNQEVHVPVKKKKKPVFMMSAVSPLKLIFSLRYLALMLRSGIPIEESISTVAKQTSDPYLRKTYDNILNDINLGRSLADSMGDYPHIFSTVIISIVRIGETTGTLEKNLIFLADYLKKQHEMSKKIKGALTYPFIILGITLVEMIGMVYYILPKLESLFVAFENTPTFTKVILDTASFIRTNTLLIIAGTAFIGIGGSFFLKSKIGKEIRDRILLSFPVFSKLMRYTILASLSRTLGVLMESGIPIVKAISITAETATNVVYAGAFREIEKEVQEGKELSISLAKYKKLFDPTYIKLVESGEKTATLEENLFYLYEHNKDEADDMVNNLTKLLEPMLMIFITVMIGIIAMAVVMPMYQLTGTINE